MIKINKAKANNTIFNVITANDYFKNSELHEDDIAIIDGNTFYPKRNSNDRIENKPGFYDYGPFIQFIDPITDKDKQELNTNNIIDFNGSDIKSIIESSNKLKDMEKLILTSDGDITRPLISDHDTPEMKLLKEAIISKNIDIRNYKSRFGSNFDNDKKLLYDDHISMYKLKQICNNLDIAVSIVLENKNSDVVNPMKSVLKAELLD